GADFGGNVHGAPIYRRPQGRASFRRTGAPAGGPAADRPRRVDWGRGDRYTGPMSGHSHWATIKHKKGTADARRGKLWSKLCRAIQISAKEGGGNPDMNLKLANAILDARAESVPNDNITRSIKRGTGELEGISYEQVTYEGYGPGGVAFMIDALTDNKNRSAAEMRKMFENSNGNLAGAGAVGFMFSRKGLVVIPVSAAGEDHYITCAVPDFENVKKALGKKYKLVSSEIAMIPKDTVKVDEETGRKIL